MVDLIHNFDHASLTAYSWLHFSDGDMLDELAQYYDFF